jgi:hypothetical protein
MTSGLRPFASKPMFHGGPRGYNYLIARMRPRLGAVLRKNGGNIPNFVAAVARIVLMFHLCDNA